MLRYFRRLKNKGFLVGSTIPVFSTNSGETESNNAPQKDDMIDGWDRLKKMYRIDEFGEISRELYTISQTAMMSSFVGLIYGGIVSTRSTYTDFMRNNTASSFSSHFEAKKKLQDAMTKSIARGGWKWCWRLCLFSTTFIGISTTISVYRSKNGILEYILAGASTGALYKWQMGPKGWIVGAGVGTLLGLTAGTLTYGLLQLTGQTMDEVRIHQQSFGNYRNEVWKKGIKEYREKEEQLLKSHDEKLFPESKVGS